MTCKGNRTTASAGAAPASHRPVPLGQLGRGGKSILVPSALEATEKPLFADALQNADCCSKGPRHTVSEPAAQAAGCGAAGLRPAGGDGSPGVFSWPGRRPHRAPCVLGSLGGPGAQWDPSRDGRVSLRPRLPGDRSPHLLGLGGSRPRPCAELESGDYLGGLLAVFLPCDRLQGGTGGGPGCAPRGARGLRYPGSRCWGRRHR